MSSQVAKTIVTAAQLPKLRHKFLTLLFTTWWKMGIFFTAESIKSADVHDFWVGIYIVYFRLLEITETLVSVLLNREKILLRTLATSAQLQSCHLWQAECLPCTESSEKYIAINMPGRFLLKNWHLAISSI